MRRLLNEERRAVLATIDDRGEPRLVPICFVLDEQHPAEPLLWTPLDEKPKRVADPMRLARVRDARARPHVEVLIDRWDEDWSRLAWLRIGGTAHVQGEAPAGVIEALRAKYPQYEAQKLEGRPVIRIAIRRVRAWGT